MYSKIYDFESFINRCFTDQTLAIAKDNATDTIRSLSLTAALMKAISSVTVVVVVGTRVVDEGGIDVDTSIVGEEGTDVGAAVGTCVSTGVGIIVGPSVGRGVGLGVSPDVVGTDVGIGVDCDGAVNFVTVKSATAAPSTPLATRFVFNAFPKVTKSSLRSSAAVSIAGACEEKMSTV